MCGQQTSEHVAICITEPVKLQQTFKKIYVFLPGCDVMKPNVPQLNQRDFFVCVLLELIYFVIGLVFVFLNFIYVVLLSLL